MFSGQGAQQIGMGKTLYENEPEVKGYWDTANRILGFDLKKIAFEGPEEELTRTEICQPALYVHGWSAYQILRKTGKLKNLKAAIGLSLGELTAHVAAGTYDFESGLKIVAKRGALMQEACEKTEGGMVSIIGGSLEDVKKLCKEWDVDVANLNCPGQVVISGERERIQKVVEMGQGMGFKRLIPLKVAGAYHSRLMRSAAEAFQSFLRDFEFKTPQVAVFSNATGQSVKDPEGIKRSLMEQITSSVLWEDCVKNVTALGVKEYYECGPGNVLKGLVRRIDPALEVHSVSEYADVVALR